MLKVVCGAMSRCGGGPTEPPARTRSSASNCACRGEVIGDAAWDAIIDRATWDQVRAILNQPRKQPRASQDYPLRGVLKCGECGRYLNAVFSKGVRNYGCRRDAGGCGKVSINAPKTEEWVYDLILWLADLPGMRDAIRADEASEASEVESLILANSADEAKKSEWAALFNDNEIDLATFRKQTRVLTERIDGRSAQLTGLRGTSALDRLGGSVADNWDDMTSDNKRLVIQVFFSDITVACAHKHGVWDWHRLSPTFRIEAMTQALASTDRTKRLVPLL
jgi:site-specific DNA recombinase